MKINVLIKDTEGDNFEVFTSVEGLYTDEARGRLQANWLPLGQKIVKEHINGLKDLIETMKNNIDKSIVPAVQGFFAKKIEEYENNLKTLESFVWTREYIEYYAKCEGYRWEVYELNEE